VGWRLRQDILDPREGKKGMEAISRRHLVRKSVGEELLMGHTCTGKISKE